MKKIYRLTTGLFIVTLIGYGLFFFRSYLLKDMSAPEIIFEEEEITAGIEDAGMALMKGVKALDDRDGNVSNSLMVESVSKTEDNRCIVEYAAYDSANNVAKAARTVIFEDYRPVHFKISQPLRFVRGTGMDIRSRISADDCMDGDISNKIKVISENENYANLDAGIYNYTIQVENSIGDVASLPVSVELYDDSWERRLNYPEIYLSSYIVYLKEGESFVPTDHLLGVGLGNELHLFEENTENGYNGKPSAEEIAAAIGTDKTLSNKVNYDLIRYQSNVNTYQQGIYTVEYSCTTNDYTGTTQMIVVVE